DAGDRHDRGRRAVRERAEPVARGGATAPAAGPDPRRDNPARDDRSGGGCCVGRRGRGGARWRRRRRGAMNWIAFAAAAWLCFGLELGLKSALSLGGGEAGQIAPSFVVPLAV